MFSRTVRIATGGFAAANVHDVLSRITTSSVPRPTVSVRPLSAALATNFISVGGRAAELVAVELVAVSVLRTLVADGTRGLPPSDTDRYVGEVQPTVMAASTRTAHHTDLVAGTTCMKILPSDA